MDWTTVVWRCLCGLVIMSGFVAVTGLWEALPGVVRGLMMIPGLLVMLVLAVACWADWSASRGASTTGSSHE